MAPESNPGAQTEEESGSLLVLALLAPLVGAAAGLLGAIFRLVLEEADRFRDALIARLEVVRRDHAAKLRPR